MPFARSTEITSTRLRRRTVFCYSISAPCWYSNWPAIRAMNGRGRADSDWAHPTREVGGCRPVASIASRFSMARFIAILQNLMNGHGSICPSLNPHVGVVFPQLFSKRELGHEHLPWLVPARPLVPTAYAAPRPAAVEGVKCPAAAEQSGGAPTLQRLSVFV